MFETSDWVEYQQQLLSRRGELAKLSPDTVKGYQSLSSAGAKTGGFDAKTRELIALACAVTLRCDGCITVHTAAALKNGAARDEVAKALGVAIAVGAGATLVYSARVLDAWAHTAKEPRRNRLIRRCQPVSTFPTHAGALASVAMLAERRRSSCRTDRETLSIL